MKCKKCGKIKTRDDFYKNKNVKSGYFSHCKNCHNGRGMNWLAMTKAEKDAKNKELLDYAREYCDRHPKAKESLINWLVNGVKQNRSNNWDRVEENMRLYV